MAEYKWVIGDTTLISGLTTLLINTSNWYRLFKGISSSNHLFSGFHENPCCCI